MSNQNNVEASIAKIGATAMASLVGMDSSGQQTTADLFGIKPKSSKSENPASHVMFEILHSTAAEQSPNDNEFLLFTKSQAGNTETVYTKNTAKIAKYKRKYYNIKVYKIQENMNAELTNQKYDEEIDYEIESIKKHSENIRDILEEKILSEKNKRDIDNIISILSKHSKNPQKNEKLTNVKNNTALVAGNIVSGEPILLDLPSPQPEHIDRDPQWLRQEGFTPPTLEEVRHSWPVFRNGDESPIDFVRRVYANHGLGSGLTTAHIRHADPKLYKALYNWRAAEIGRDKILAELLPDGKRKYSGAKPTAAEMMSYRKVAAFLNATRSIKNIELSEILPDGKRKYSGATPTAAEMISYKKVEAFRNANGSIKHAS